MHPERVHRVAAAARSKASRAARTFTRLVEPVESLARPLVDLAIRLWFAQGFFVSAILKIADWDTALSLARTEYPVAWLSPERAAFLGAGVELIGSVLLAVGLSTRLAAVALGGLYLVIQLEYRALDVNLLGAASLAWIALRGADALSVDALLRRGLARSAIPGAAAALKGLAFVDRHAEPVFRVGVRLALFVACSAAASGDTASLWLPVRTAASFVGIPWLACAAALAVGAATRPVALLWLVASILATTPAVGAEATLAWLALVAWLFVSGAGPWSVDRLLGKAARLALRRDDDEASSAVPPRHVVIVGAGFGGIACASALDGAGVRVTLIDRNNHHLFQPLLYQVATCALSPADIAVPIRSMFRDRPDVRVVLGTVTAVDSERREIALDGRRIAFDYLVLATGATHGYFGKEHWARHAPGLKRIEDATSVRRKVLLAFERAESEQDPDERSALLTFVIVGGGPTGVELAGALAELARFGMADEFRDIDPHMARIVLVQSGERLLPAFPDSLSSATRASLERLGVEVRLASRVGDIDSEGAWIDGRLVRTRTILWAAGVMASPAAAWLGARSDAVGRLEVEPDLSVPGHEGIFAIGDTALSHGWRGDPVPGLAPAAKQAGQYVARVLRARVAGAAAPDPFVYRHLGSLATIGRKSAVAQFGPLRLSGTTAWWLWGIVHVGFLLGVRNRVSVMLDWFWSYLTYRGGARLITSEAAAPGFPSDAREPAPRELEPRESSTRTGRFVA